MGCTSSVDVNMPLDFKYFAIQMSHTGKFRLISPSPFIIKKTKKLLEEFWGKISNSRESPGFLEFQLKKSDSWTDVQMKLFMCHLIKDYYDIGWHLKVSTDLKYYDGNLTDVVIFERKIPISTHVICVSLNESNLLRIFAGDDVLQSIKSMAIKFWPYGIINVQTFDKYYEIELRRNPWSSSSANEDDSYFAVALINLSRAKTANKGIVNSAITSIIDTALNLL